MIFDFDIYQLDVDVERTRVYYEADHRDICSCPGCRNFDLAVHSLPESIQQFFRSLGIDIGKPENIGIYFSRDGLKTYYDGFYNICGTILNGKDPWTQTDERAFTFDDSCRITLTDDFFVYFSRKPHLLDKSFPLPAIAVEFQGYIPWVLDEPNPYFKEEYT